MVKTKSEKHTLDDEKRRHSIKTREEARLSQSVIIKQALSNTSLRNNSNKKIVFDNENDDGEGNLEHKKRNGEKRESSKILFDDSGSEEETPTIKEKIQFSGKKGFELLNLQSTYGNDERFKIDERFLEDEKESSDVNNDDNSENKDETDPSKEKEKMLNILGSVLGEPVTAPISTKPKKRQFDMIRYDASKKEHEIYEIKPDHEILSSSKKKRLKGQRDVEEQPKPHVSKEKFYEVSGEIKNSFHEKKEGQFSLLQTYGADDVHDDQEMEEHEDMEEEEVVTEEEVESDPEVRESKPMEKPKEEKKAVLAQGIWRESFFFDSDDPRFKESFEFINKKNSTEAAEAAENYGQTRRQLKEIFRLHMKKQQQKKDPFKNKIGGSNKKQLSNPRSSKRFMAGSRRPKVTPRRKP